MEKTGPSAARGNGCGRRQESRTVKANIESPAGNSRIRTWREEKMDRIPPLAFLLQTIPESFLIIALGLLLVGYRPPWRKLAAASVLASVGCYFARSLPLPFGVHTFIMVAVIAGLVSVFFGLGRRRAVLGALAGVTALALAESISIPLVTATTGRSMAEIMASTSLRILAPLPHMAFLAAVAWYSWRFAWAPFCLDDDARSQRRSGT